MDRILWSFDQRLKHVVGRELARLRFEDAFENVFGIGHERARIISPAPGNRALTPIIVVNRIRSGPRRGASAGRAARRRAARPTRGAGIPAMRGARTIARPAARAR